MSQTKDDFESILNQEMQLVLKELDRKTKQFFETTKSKVNFKLDKKRGGGSYV